MEFTWGSIKASARDRLAVLVLVTPAKTHLLIPFESFHAKARSADRQIRIEITIQKLHLQAVLFDPCVSHLIEPRSYHTAA